MKAIKEQPNWITISIVIYLAILICLILLPVSKHFKGDFDRIFIVTLFTLIVYHLTLGAISVTGWLAKRNLDTLNKQLSAMRQQNETAEENLNLLRENIGILKKEHDLAKSNIELLSKDRKIEYQSLVLEQICLGILNPSGSKEPPSNETAPKRYYNRIKNNGFYDGVRTFLGDMMNASHFGGEEFKQAKTDHKYDVYFNGATRFGLSWDDLFKKFADVCDMMDVSSGLEEYPNKQHSYHIMKKLPYPNIGIKELEKELVNNRTAQKGKFISQSASSLSAIPSATYSTFGQSVSSGSFDEILDVVRSTLDEIYRDKKIGYKAQYPKHNL